MKHATENPWEVHSSTGLEDSFADRDEADAYAGELRRSGANDVRVKARDRLRPPRLPGSPPMYHTPQGRPPGVPNPGKLEDVRVGGRILRGWSPSQDIFEMAADAYASGNEAGADEAMLELGYYSIAIRKGMTGALWITSYADWVENDQEPADRRHMDSLFPRPGGSWESVAPTAPDSAHFAADDLYCLIERANNTSTADPTTTLMNLYHRAVEADAKVVAAPFVPDEKYAELFGHYLAMEALGHGVTWTDDHAEFPIRIPSYECYSGDGETVDWSPHVIRRESAAPRPAPRAAVRTARAIAKKKNPDEPQLWRVWLTKRADDHYDVDAPSALAAIESSSPRLTPVVRSMRGVVVEINARPVGEPTGATHSHHVRLGRGGRMEIVR